MQICVKATTSEIEILVDQMKAARRARGLSNAEIGKLAAVHPSQVGRICSGDVRTITGNVVQVCKVLGLSVETVDRPAEKDDQSWARLEASVRTLWDRTPEGAEKIIRMLDTIALLKSG